MRQYRAELSRKQAIENELRSQVATLTIRLDQSNRRYNRLKKNYDGVVNDILLFGQRKLQISANTEDTEDQKVFTSSDSPTHDDMFEAEDNIIDLNEDENVDDNEVANCANIPSKSDNVFFQKSICIQADDGIFTVNVSPSLFLSNDDDDVASQRSTNRHHFECIHCNAQFTTEIIRNEHQHTCNVISGGTMVDQSLLEPMQPTSTSGIEQSQRITFRGSSRTFDCGKCDKSFLSISSLKRHELTHRQPQHPCPICKKKFFQKTSVPRHMKALHKNVPVPK